MKRIYLIAAIVAVLSGGLAYVYLQSLSASASLQTPTAEATEYVTVMRATSDIPAFTELTTSNTAAVQVPTSDALAGVATSFEQLSGRCCSSELVAGEFIYSAKLMIPGSGGGSLSYRVPEGMRAITVSVVTDTGVADYLKQGDHVDVNAIITEESGSTSMTLAEDVELICIGVGNDTDKSTTTGSTVTDDVAVTDSYSSVTLLVTPQQANKIVLARTEGKLCLTLRGVGDSEMVGDSAVTTSDL